MAYKHSMTQQQWYNSFFLLKKPNLESIWRGFKKKGMLPHFENMVKLMHFNYQNPLGTEYK